MLCHSQTLRVLHGILSKLHGSKTLTAFPIPLAVDGIQNRILLLLLHVFTLQLHFLHSDLVLNGGLIRLAVTSRLRQDFLGPCHGKSRISLTLLGAGLRIKHPRLCRHSLILHFSLCLNQLGRRRTSLRSQELCRISPTKGLQSSRIHSNRVIKRRTCSRQLLQSSNLHQTLRLTCRVWIGLRGQFTVIESLQECLLVPWHGRTAVFLPKTFWIFLETPHQKGKFLRLSLVHTLVDRVQNLLRLLNHGKGCPHRGVLLALINYGFSGPAYAHPRFSHVVDKVHQRARRLFVRQWHNGLGDRHTPCFYQRAPTGRNAEDVGILPSARVCHKKAGEVVIHPSVQKLTPSSRNGIGCITQNVKQTNVIEPHSGDKCILYKVLPRFRKLGSIFVIVSDN